MSIYNHEWATLGAIHRKLVPHSNNSAIICEAESSAAFVRAITWHLASDAMGVLVPTKKPQLNIGSSSLLIPLIFADDMFLYPRTFHPVI